MLQLSPVHNLNTFFRLGIHCLVQAINRVHVFGEKFISEVAVMATTKWKLILFIVTIMYIFFKVLQKTREELKATEEVILITRLFQMIKNTQKPGVTTDIISLIEKHKIDVNRKHPKSESGLTLFLCACLSGDNCLILYMLNKGADINSNTSCKDSALHLASFFCGTQKVSNCLGVITSLFEAGCDINSQNWVGNTPLTIAASSGNCNLVQHLISLGADKSLCTNDGIYPMDFAINSGHLDAANLLAIAVPNPHVWDIVEPHTPPRVKLGLQSPCKQHLVNSSFRRSRMDFTKKQQHTAPSMIRC
ncbi:death-associated protein kinase 1 [Pocillopora verrucosa]|uniref:death-associated protein kinase 1 n=1 Tax=Pocillopora verrucosa TaxID=203993 RepID=UPI002797AB4F|nr:death-associated protein kinase 1-like [Pocillopora verrucosa]